MKAITIYQPWASLIALGEKEYETRGWAVRWTGELAIHAGKRRDQEVEADFNLLEVRTAFARHGIFSIDQLPFGAVICITHHNGCIPVESIPPRRRRFGNYAPGRYGWEETNVRVFDTPIPAIGQQGVWDWRGEYSPDSLTPVQPVVIGDPFLSTPRPPTGKPSSSRYAQLIDKPSRSRHTVLTGTRCTWAERARATGIRAYGVHGDVRSPEDTLAWLHNVGTTIPLGIDMQTAIRALFNARAVALMSQRRDYIKKFRDGRLSEKTAETHINALTTEIKRMRLMFWLEVAERMQQEIDRSPVPSVPEPQPQML